MSLAINPDNVASVLLGDKWIKIYPGSFDIDAYEFVIPSKDSMENDFIVHGGGRSGICASGFRFQSNEEPNEIVCGPLSEIKAVSYLYKKKVNKK